MQPQTIRVDQCVPPPRALLALVVLCAACYAPFLGGGYLTDDFAHLHHLQQNPSLVSELTTPNPFGFFRPIPQLSYQLDAAIFGRRPVGFRVTNLIVHTAVVCAAFFLATLLLGGVEAALFATLAFALTPKAHPIAVLWMSARPELLMALFVLLAAICWIRWSRAGRTGMLVLAFVFYALALLSKETAALLPLVLLVTPIDTRHFAARRAAAVAGLLVMAGGLFALRAQTGALMPTSIDPHYSLATPLARWTRNATNYFRRVLPSPLALWVAAAAAAAFRTRRLSILWPPDARQFALPAYACVWFVAFLLPVIPIAARSELYLYLPGFGFCLFAGQLVQGMRRSMPSRAALSVAVTIFVAATGGYLVSRSMAIRQDAGFTERLVAALGASAEVRQHQGAVLLVPRDPATEGYLRDGVGGYLDTVLKVILRRSDIGGAVAYPGERWPAPALRVGCAYENGQIVLTPLGVS